MNALKIILPVACLLSFSTYSFAELDEEIVTSVDASAYVVESDHPFDSLDDHEKSVIRNTFQSKIASKIHF